MVDFNQNEKKGDNNNTAAAVYSITTSHLIFSRPSFIRSKDCETSFCKEI